MEPQCRGDLAQRHKRRVCPHRFRRGFRPFFEGMYDGFMGNERNRDIDLFGATKLIVIASFFIANDWTHFRGTV